MNFLFPPNVSWTYMYQRPQQLAMELSKQGQKVQYINTDMHPHHRQRTTLAVNEKLILHPHHTPLTSLECDILYSSYPPLFLDVHRQCPNLFSIFDSLDEPTEGYFSYWNKNNAYYASLQRADLVLTTAKTLYDKAKDYNDNVIMVPNGCDFDYFNTPQPKPIEYNNITGPIVLYSGALAPWVDIELIIQSALTYPKYTFVVIGVEIDRKLPVLPNLIYLGHQPYERVASFIQHSNVCIIPFLTGQSEVKGCNPIKMYEYLACGKPIVSTEMAETMEYCEYWSNDNFIENIQKSIEENTICKTNKRIEIAKENSWTKRVNTILKAIGELK